MKNLFEWQWHESIISEQSSQSSYSLVTQQQINRDCALETSLMSDLEFLTQIQVSDSS